jgi:2-hydroxychromene-2-carboxylate isomerase
MISKFLRNFMSRRTIFAKLRNKFMNTYANYELVKKARVKFEAERKESCASHTVIYFHKVDDPYSALTIEYVDKIISSYDVVLKPVLVGEENPETIHEPTLYNDYCLRDVNRIADYYGVKFSSNSYPKKNLVNLANSILTAVDEIDFVAIAKKVSKLLWLHDQKSLEDLELKYQASSDAVIKRLEKGNAIRDDKDYYFGSAFYYGKELYWGVDRINHLEERLDKLGLRKDSMNKSICVPNLKAPNKLESEQKFNLYYYPSLNSPYTFVSVTGVQEIKDEYPINLITKPVLPMLMRKMTIPNSKVKYIISDAAREGLKKNNPIGKIYSPIGKPARKAYSIFPIIDEAGKGFEYINELLQASFYNGVNIGEDNYLKSTVEKLGLDWNIISKKLGSNDWKKVLDDNLKDMYSGNCWGVPSFKITDANDDNPFYVWGQDRMWLLKEEIYKRLNA